MEIFDNCRICLHEINHEPIKMTRSILKFLEKYLQLANVTKPNQLDNVKQNLCAPCFNRISDFQDFHERCKDSDEFWKAQFEDLNEVNFDKKLTFEQTLFLPLAEETNSLEADTTVTTTEEKQPTNVHEEKDEQFVLTLQAEKIEQEFQVNQEKEKIVLPPPSINECEDEVTQIVDFNSIDLTNWPDETNDVKYDSQEIEIIGQNSYAATSTKDNGEIIEYEYQVEEDEEVEIEEFQEISTIDEPAVSSESFDEDYGASAYESTTIIHETMGGISETTQNAFLTTPTIDENGKMKMSYKCQHCDKTFNRVYDIESHYNIHNGVKPYNCNVCGKSFRQKNILTTHQALHFGKKVECAECGKKFARRSQLILHYRMHRNEKPFICNYEGCEAAFRQRKQLIDHSYIHSGEKNFQCAACTKSFHTRKRLQDHIYKVHSQHRYRCDLCEKAFLKPHMLKNHMMTAHNMEVADVSHLKTLVEDLKPTPKKSRSTILN